MNHRFLISFGPSIQLVLRSLISKEIPTGIQLELVNKRPESYNNLFVLISTTPYLNNSVSVSGLNGSPELDCTSVS